MPVFNRKLFNAAQFNFNSQPQASDAAFLTEVAVVLTVNVTETFIQSDEVNISQQAADSAVVSETAEFINLVSASDSAAVSESAVLLTVQTSDSALQSNTTSIVAAVPGSDSGSLSETTQTYLASADSATVSETPVVKPVAFDSAVETETTSLTFAIGFVDATVVTQTALSTGAGISIRTTPILSEVTNVLFVQQKDFTPTSGSCIVRVAAGISIFYEIQLADFSYKSLVTQGITSNGDLGTAARVAAAQATGSQTLKTVSGNLLNLFGLPSQTLLIRMTTSCIDRAGVFRTRELAVLPINPLNGSLVVSLPSTSDLYVPGGGQVLYEIVQNRANFPRIGKLGFTVPSGAGPFTFGVSAGSIIVQ